MKSTTMSDPAREAGTERLPDRALVTAFLENVPDFVHFKDRDGRFIAVSKSQLRGSGLKHGDEIVGKTDFDFFSTQNAQRAKDDEDEIIRTGVPLVDKLEHVHWSDGRETWSLINKMPLCDEQGVIIGTFGITKDVTESKKTERALEQARKELLDASRMAGMAEVATGVLHNVGNVLNSLNISTTILSTGLREQKTDSLAKIGDMLREHSSDLADFLQHDPKGRLVPAFIESLARHFAEDRHRLLQEIEALQRNVGHIKEIVSMQQAYATRAGTLEPLDAAALLEDALRMNSAALQRHEIRVQRDFSAVPAIQADRGKVLQILVNLISNAKYAASDCAQAEKLVTLRLAPGASGRVRLTVQDNGVGIPAGNLARIFQHGFTTKATGHGFGLHTSANAAKEMKGTLTAHSDGPDRGSSFILDLPAAPTPDASRP